jgi:hypothetical protein
LIETPFAPLHQEYQKCHYDPGTVAVNQAGSSVGTLSLVTPVLIALVLGLVYLGQVCVGLSIRKTYTAADKEEALQELALKLLLTRDKGGLSSDGESSTGVSEKGQSGVVNPMNRANSSRDAAQSSRKKQQILAGLVEELSEEIATQEEIYTIVAQQQSEPTRINWTAAREAVHRSVCGSNKKTKKKRTFTENDSIELEDKNSGGIA